MPPAEDRGAPTGRLCRMGQAKPLRLALLFGGRSAEHEVSLDSARTVRRALDPARYRVELVGIDREGGFLDPEDSEALLDGGAARGTPRAPYLPTGTQVVFPVLHGPFGEDGTVQGWLELCGVPFVGGDSTSSGVAMDKSLTRHVLRSHGIPMLPWVDVAERDWRADAAAIETRVLERCGLPLFVKPARLGSSVGIGKVTEAAGLHAAFDEAFRHGRFALAEPALDGRELEFAVLDGDPPLVVGPGEICPQDWYDYKSKYVEDTAALHVPAPDLHQELADGMRLLALEAFRALRLDGMARVDFFLGRKTGKPVLNEVNSIPGFTAISMYPKLLEHAGIPIAEICDRLVDLALQRASLRRVPAASPAAQAAGA